MSDIGTGDILGAGAFIVVVLRTIFDFIGPRFKKNGNGSSGEKSAEYWELTIEAIMEKVMTRRNVMIKELVNEAISENLKRRGL